MPTQRGVWQKGGYKMKGRKKLLAALLAAAMTVSMVAGCGSTGTADTAAPAASA